MLSNKTRATQATLGRSKSSDSEYRRKSKTGVLFKVAVAVRKFQKFESDKYKKALKYDFDKQTAVDELRNLYSADKAFFLKESVKLAYFIRKFNLTFEDLNFLGKKSKIIHEALEHLKDGLLSKADERMLHFLCLSLKYLTRNSEGETDAADISSIALLIVTCESSLIKNELVSLLVSSFEKLNSTDQNLELEKLIHDLPEINQDAKVYLLGKLEINKAVEQQATDDHTKSTMEIRKVKKNQRVVSKTIQTVKSKHETKNSEETDFDFLSLSDCMKSRNKKLNTALEPLALESKSGSDRSMFSSTWGEALNLFQIVSDGQVLKDDDKNNYLPKRFLGYHYMYFTDQPWDSDAAKMYSFFINRMFASIFRKISKRQQINEKGIDKLLQCITDFENLVSVLDIKADFVTFFTDRILQRYRELKKIKSPDVIVDFVKAIMEKTTEEYLVRGWIYNSIEVRRKSYDRETVEKIIAAEINRVRLDAINALYNCAIRDKKKVLTNDRLEIIRKYAENPDEGRHSDKKFMEYVFKLIELAETLNDFDYKKVFATYLNKLTPSSTDNVDAILRFINNQARDLKRSRELFSDDVMETLIRLIGPDSSFSINQKLEVAEIISVCLEHETTDSLSEKNLQELLKHAFKSENPSLMKSSLNSLLLSADKKRSLSQDILKILFKNFELQSHNEDCTSYMVFILSRVFCADGPSQKYFLGNPSYIELVSSKLLCDHIVEFDTEDDEQIKFSPPSEKSSCLPSNQISFLSAKIISRSVENKVILSSDTTDRLFLVVQNNNENDKQAKIIASKCLYSLTKYMPFDEGSLNQLFGMINSTVYDVSVYLQAAYLRECVKVAQTPKLLNSIHLENISALYITDSLKLGQHDYEEEINENLFKTLLYEARKQEFNDKNIFLLFDNILNLNGKYAPQVLGILVAYTFNYIIPETTIRTLENLLSVASYFEKALLILQNVIFSGKATLTSKTLTIFVDYLCFSSNSRLRFYSFKLLQQASQNQELPYDIFCKFEMVKAAFALQCHPGNKQIIIDFIYALTEKGLLLPADTKLSLGKEIRNTSVLKIFANVSRNRQIIEQNLLLDLIKLFDPITSADKDILLLKIFENAAKNNQALPDDLLKKLEVALGKKDLERSVLPVFIYLAQKGENLSEQVNNKLLDWLSAERDPILRQELLSSLGSLIDANRKTIMQYLPKLNQILIREIGSDNFNIQKLCMTTINKLVTVSRKIDKGLIEELVEIGTDVNCDELIRSEIEALFETAEDDYIRRKRYKEKIKLANLHLKSFRDILAQLTVYANLDDVFLPQNYQQLKDIMNNRDLGLQEQALAVLHSYKHKSKMTDDLLESVAILFESTMSENIKSSCVQLLNDTVKNGKALTGRACEIWEAEVNRDENINKSMKSPIVKKMKQEFNLSEHVILDLLHLTQVTKKISAVETLADFIRFIITEKSDYYKNQSFVLLVEKCLIANKALEITLPCYCRIIKEYSLISEEIGSSQKERFQECLHALVEHFCKKEEDTVDLQQPQLFESMYYANKFTNLSDLCMFLTVNNLDNRNEIIRKYSFGILRTSSGTKYEIYQKALSYWCDSLLKSLAQNENVNIGELKDLEMKNLLETIVSVKFFDSTVFKTKEQKLWRRELLASSIFENFKVFPMDQMLFYMRWFVVEEKFKPYKSCMILSLIQNSKFDSFSQIVKLISIIPELKFDDVVRLLTIHWPEPYDAFKQNWCVGKIQTCTVNNISSEYCNKLARKLCSSFDINFIGKLFGCLKSVDNLSTFEDLVDFCLREEIDMEDMMGLENLQLNDLKLLIEIKHLCKRSKRQPENETEGKDFLQIYKNLNEIGWNFSHLNELVITFNPKAPFDRFQNLLHLLKTILTYHLLPSSNFKKCKQIFTDFESFQEMIRELNKLAIENHFQLEGKVKDLNELIAELEKTNKSDQELVDFIQKSSLEIRKLITGKEFDKSNWTEKTIYDWAKKIRTGKEKFSDYEAIAIIRRANYIVTGHTLTDVQILCSLIALKSGGRNLKGKLLQVATGEGKSTIICILAIINALRGKKVDVITSSPVLAERDAKQKAKLYRLFALSCSDNNDKTVYLKGRKDCYLSDIVYGEMSQFQFDILRDNYSKLGTLGDREFTTAIVDEVDSMLIDDSSKIARLSTTIPGMDHFQAVYVFVWQHLLSIKQKLIMFNGKMYFVYGQVGFENEKITLEIADQNNDVKKLPDLESYLLNTKDISPIGEVVEDIDDYLRKSLETYLDYQIKENKLYIPSNFKEFLKKQKSKWIANAVEAFNYQENIHYVVQDGEIKPVDYYSTGIVQSSTNWSDGLHQFLQLKHNLKMTSETLTTNFLSNIGFMKKYEQVYGMTGTLGSETARNVLKDIYKVDLINIPQRRQKQYLELESVIAQGEADWLKAIKSNIMLEIQKERGILVICETIEHANRISKLLKNKLRSSAVKLYTMNDMNQEKNVEKIMPGEVIIATNLAGRGTDIQTDEIEATGGLHVILTFMPSNQRVEDQAFGRTARQGKRGTGLMILNAHLLEGNATTTKAMKMVRDEVESRQLKEFREKELKLIEVKDKLFDTFCSFLNDELRVQIRKERNSCWSKIKNWFTETLPTTYESCVLAAIEEQWAGFLSKLDEGVIKSEDAESKCQALISQLRNDFKTKNLIKNSYYNISIANDIVFNDSSKVKEAIDYFKTAIELEEKARSKKEKSEHQMGGDGEPAISNEEKSKKDEETGAVYSAGAAHLGIAWCSILLKEEGYKEKALSSFRTALKSLSNEMSVLNATQLLLQEKQPGFVNSDLYKQLNIKTTILGSYLNGIHGCIEAIKRSKRLIDVVAVKEHGKVDVLATVKHYNEQERMEKNPTSFKDFKLSKEKSYSLTFNNLIIIRNSTDQALETVDNAFLKEAKDGNAKLKEQIFGSDLCPVDGGSYSNIRINMKQVDLARISSSLFNPNKEFKNLTRENAIAKLKAERTYYNMACLTNSYETNLIISSNDKTNVKEVYKKKQINELIRIVEDQKISDSSLRFDIEIENANENEINKIFKSKSDSERSVKLNVGFNDLSQEVAIAKLSSVKARSFDVQFVLNRANLFKLIASDASLQSCLLDVSKKQLLEKVNIIELQKRLKRLDTDDSPCFVRFEQLTFEQANNIVKNCHDKVVFTISFLDVYDFYGSELTEGQVNFSFDQLNQNTAKTVINVLRNENFEFSLEFRNLSDKETRFILKHANLEQEDLEIRKVKNVSEMFMKNSTPTLELNEFISKGIEFIIEINEKLFVPWRSVVSVAALGVSQVILGGVLIASGFGATLGMGIISEGISDVFTAYRAYSSRQFHWSDYCKQKSVSLALTFGSVGIKNLKNAKKGLDTITKGVGQKLLGKAGQFASYNNEAVGQTLINTGGNLRSLACKFIGVKVAEAVGRECLNTGIKALSNMAFDTLKPKISESVQTRVRSSFCNTELIGFLRKMHAIDLATNSNQLQTRIDQIVSETVNPRNDFMRRQWESVGLPLLKGVLSDSSMYGNSASMAFRIFGTLNGLYQVKTLTDNVTNTLVAKLRLVDENSMTINLIFHTTLKMKKNHAKVIANKFKKLGIFNDCDNFQVRQSDLSEDSKELKAKIDEVSAAWAENEAAIAKELLDLLENIEDPLRTVKNEESKEKRESIMKKDIKNSIAFVNLFYMKFVNLVDLDSFSKVMKSVSDQIADQLIRIMDSQMIQPWSTLAMSSLTDHISKQIQHYCLVNKEQNSSSQKEDQEKYEKLSQKNAEDLNDEEKAFMANYGKFRIFAQQINYNSKNYCIAYSQCEIVYHSGLKGSGSNNSSRDVKKGANDVAQGGPVNLAAMNTAAKNNGVNLKIVDNKNYCKTQEDIDNNVEIVYFERGLNNQIGHAYYMDSNGQLLEAKGTGYDCFFAAFSAILENKGISKSIADLRKETAQQMLNSENFEKVLAAEKWIRDNHPEASNNMLFTAGLYRDSNNRIIVEMKDVDDFNMVMDVRRNKKKHGFIFTDTLEELDPDPEKSRSAHHLIPHSIIRQLFKESYQKNKTELREKLEDYINKDHIKSIIDEKINIIPRPESVDKHVHLDSPEGRINYEPEYHGALLDNAVFNNPHNLVKGPIPKHRKYDPSQVKPENLNGLDENRVRRGFDEELILRQTTDFQSRLDTFDNNNATPEDFLNLPRTTSVNWKKEDSNKYVVQDPIVQKNVGGGGRNVP